MSNTHTQTFAYTKQFICIYQTGVFWNMIKKVKGMNHGAHPFLEIRNPGFFSYHDYWQVYALSSDRKWSEFRIWKLLSHIPVESQSVNWSSRPKQKLLILNWQYCVSLWIFNACKYCIQSPSLQHCQLGSQTCICKDVLMLKDAWSDFSEWKFSSKWCVIT